MMPTPLLITLSSLSVYVPGLLAAIRWRLLDPLQRSLALLVWVNGLIQALAIIIPEYTDFGNIPLYHLYVPLELTLMAWISLKHFSRLPTKAVWLLVILFWGFAGWNALFYQTIHDFPALTRGIESSLIVLLALVYFYETLRKAEPIRLESTAAFWIYSGLALYFASNLLIFLFAHLIFRGPGPGFDAPWFLHASLNILLYLSFTLALLCPKQTTT